MDAIKFINEKVRMCNSISAKGHNCSGCRLNELGGCDFEDLVAQDRVEKAVELVEEWSKENPRKTRQSVFLEQYPDTFLDSYGVISFCPVSLSAAYRNNNGDCENPERMCSDCRRDFWSQEV